MCQNYCIVYGGNPSCLNLLLQLKVRTGYAPGCLEQCVPAGGKDWDP